MGDVAPFGAQVLPGAAGVHGEEGGQDLRHRQQGRAGAGPRAAVARAAARAQRRQLARARRAARARQDVPPLQERRAAHQVSAPAAAHSVCD